MSWHIHQTRNSAHRESAHGSSILQDNHGLTTTTPCIVDDVLASPGRPLDVTTRSLMETQFNRNLRREPPLSSVSEDRPGRLRVNKAGDRHEQEAHRVSRQVLTSSATTDTSTPPARFDFSRVRVHTDTKANASARAVAAQSYTLGDHIVFGSGKYAPDDRAGRQLLAHELTHVAQQSQIPAAKTGLIQRVGFFESIARFFGGGTFSDEELALYIDALEGRNRIEDNIDSDNKAREVVLRGMHGTQSLNIRILLIREMLSGFTGDDDEQAIITILNDATPTDQERIIESVGTEELLGDFQGEERDRLYRILAQVSRNRRQDISSSWSFTLVERGAERFRTDEPVILDNLTIRPDNAPQTIQVASGVANSTGAPVSLNPSLPHPRDVGGTGYLSVHTAASPQTTAAAATRLVAPYAALTRDHHDITTNLNITYRTERVGDVSRTGETQRSTQRQTGTGSRQTSTTGTSRTTGTGETASTQTQLEASREREQGQSTRVEEGSSQTTETTVTLSGEITPEVRGSVSLGGEFQIGAEALSGLLLLAGPEGIALYAMLNGLGLLESTHFKVTGRGELGFSLQVRLSAQVARRWSETRSRVVSAGTTASTRVGERAQAGRERSRTQQTSSTESQQSAQETSTSASRVESTGERTASTATDLSLVPVIDQAEVRFQVR